MATGYNDQQDVITGILLPSALTESFELVLSRLVDLERDGKSFVILACNGKVKGCVSNYLGIESVCKHCRWVRDQALLDTVGTDKVYLLDDYYSERMSNITQKKVSEINISVNSTILTFYRRDIKAKKQNPLYRLLNKVLTNQFRLHSLFVLNSLQCIINKGFFSKIEFFNGRIVPTMAAMVAAKYSDIDYGVLEVSGRDRHLMITENGSVHDIELKQSKLHRYLDNNSIDHTAGYEFFQSRREGQESNHRSFTTNQKKGQISKKELPILAIFTSSADELMVAGDQWFTKSSKDPINFIIELSDKLGSAYEVIVRMHPNQAGDKTDLTKDMKDILSMQKNIHLIPPQSSISSYELLDLSDAVLTFGSTMGLEATFWGKPSILAGRAIWEKLDIAYIVDSPEETAKLLKTKLVARSRQAALGVGAYFMMGTGKPGSLSWRHNGVTGFSVNGRSYIDLKRKAISYWVTRLVDRFIRVV